MYFMRVVTFSFEPTPMQYTDDPQVVKIDNYHQNIFETVLTSTHNLGFGLKLRKYVYPCKLQFYYIKRWGKRGYVNFSRTCYSF